MDGTSKMNVPTNEISVNNLPGDSASLKAMLREVLAKLESVRQISSARSGLPNSCGSGPTICIWKTCDLQQ